MLKIINKIDNAVGGFRVEIMALSIIWVMLLHGCELYPSVNIPVFTMLCELGNIGVDIFLLLSGYGLYFSMRKNPDKLGFYKKRCKKVMFPFLIITVPYWIIITVLNHESILSFLGNATGISLFTDGTVTFWYAFFILFMYAVFPFLFSLIRKGTALPVIIGIIAFNIIMMFAFPEMYSRIEIASTRIVIFIVGSLIAKIHFNDGNKTKADCVIVLAYVVICAALFIASPVLRGINKDIAVVAYRYGSGGASIIFVVFVSFFKFIKDNKFLKIIGGITLEIYLIHIIIRKVIVAVGLNKVESLVAMAVIWFTAMVVSVLISYGYNKLYNCILKRIETSA